MTTYVQRPWLARYRDGSPADTTPEFGTMLELFRATVAVAPDSVAIRYFDGVLTFADLDARSDALAVALAEYGFTAGSRLAIYTQNDPAFVLGLLGAWKAGGTAVMINPMNKHRELAWLLADSGATALLCLAELYDSIAREVISGGGTDVHTVITCSPLDDQSRDDERLFAGLDQLRPRDTLDLRTLLADYAGRTAPVVKGPHLADIAVLTYTSGTTGVPKGAMNTHTNLVFNAQTFRDWVGLDANDTILGVAPLFHITGLVGHVCASLLTGCPLVLAHRFEPRVVMDAIREHRPTFTIGSITVFISLSSLEGVTWQDWSSFRVLYSGGAPIAPAVVDGFEAKTGRYLHNCYGLTETSSVTHMVPLGTRAPVDPGSGALSVGVPVSSTMVRVLSENGDEVPAGTLGEIVSAGPQVVPGYWHKPEATAESLPGGELRTGDVGFMNEQGWFFVVDRTKDMINAAGYKVWPREVEDVLYGHPAVREAAVVGVPDAYRGETVKAYVSLKPGAEAGERELIDFAKQRMAAYKYPRSVEILAELPKTATGKILRRELRRRAP